MRQARCRPGGAAMSARRRRRSPGAGRRRPIRPPRQRRTLRRDRQAAAAPARGIGATQRVGRAGCQRRDKPTNGCRPGARRRPDDASRAFSRSRDEARLPDNHRLLPGFLFAGQVPPSTRKCRCPASAIPCRLPPAPGSTCPPKLHCDQYSPWPPTFPVVFWICATSRRRRLRQYPQRPSGWLPDLHPQAADAVATRTPWLAACTGTATQSVPTTAF
ncbi:MAG: hypothetical protein AW08_01081 [Candidatus Accumulibacter adjunctus]|uniref:Uncharacterized protein n=1 Tax=Candidatus Accumulibacter adjunctus TaxID=1454001 RepID=A0A011PR05_9PROT|nr:MAG: hypothetical protein AW08_01081 [Candidatus Accumulibacter adjunctus]